MGSVEPGGANGRSRIDRGGTPTHPGSRWHTWAAPRQGRPLCAREKTKRSSRERPLALHHRSYTSIIISSPSASHSVITRSPMHASRQAHHLLAPTALVDRRLSRAALASAGFCTCRHRGAGERRTPEGSYVPSNRCTQTHGHLRSAFNTLARRRAGHACRGS